MKRILRTIVGFLTISGLMFSCETAKQQEDAKEVKIERKKVVYQVFTRLFGNTNTTNTPWGTIEENGVGKFNDFDDKALTAMKDLGVTHMWYTGVPHHAVINDYTEYGISNDDPDRASTKFPYLSTLSRAEVRHFYAK